ncbi:hypothetical protein [Plantactinospora sonchi]|uniref:Uncharacterized protein n=1 Tax=Plantactinospora sonchi TaxID=1544735 RepID=A0ABU7S4P3_9ACTN
MTLLQRRRCATCDRPIRELARLVAYPGTAVLERFTTTTPVEMPADAVDVTWLAYPCMHELAEVDAWDLAVDEGWAVRHDRAA